MQLARGPGYVLYALMDFVVDQFVADRRAIEEEVQGARGWHARRPDERECDRASIV